jgi:HNH endonuclease
MSNFSGPRIKRGSGPPGKLTDDNVRDRALSHLLRDFDERCAYSMRHKENNGGLRQMEIDHFDPTLRRAERNAYTNLMLATRHCNLMKTSTWSKPVLEEANPVRLLNPCAEQDYGKHLFENPVTHELVAVSENGNLQIDVMDLNHPTFVKERAERAEYYSKRQSPALITGSFSEVLSILEMADAVFGRCIPLIPPPPGEPGKPTA